MILHEIFRVVSGFPRYISCYIAENGIPLGQCIFRGNIKKKNTLYNFLSALMLLRSQFLEKGMLIKYLYVSTIYMVRLGT